MATLVMTSHDKTKEPVDTRKTRQFQPNRHQDTLMIYKRWNVPNKGSSHATRFPAMRYGQILRAGKSIVTRNSNRHKGVTL